MRLITLAIFLILHAVSAQAQRENVWALNRSGLDFNTINGEPIPITTALDTKESSASICDENGKLLFYTEGSIVWNKNHQIMPNGTMLTPFANTFMTPTASSSQGAVIIPVIDQPNKYYIFSLVASEWGKDLGNLYYSIVDMSLNNGLGDVMTTEKAVFVSSGLIEKMVPVVGNDCNIWLLTCSKIEQFHAFEISENGVNKNAVISNVGVGTEREVYGVMIVSPNRKRIAAASPRKASLFDFNPSTGLITNELIVHNRGAYGVCFSPDNSKLYISGYGIQSAQTIQFDLSTGNADSIRQSATNLGGLQFVNLKAGPNGKIYFGSSTTRLGEIKFPNLRGVACGFTPNAIILPNGADLTSNPALPNLIPILKKEKITTVQNYNIPFLTSVFIQALDGSGMDYTWNDGVTGPNRTINNSGTYWVSYHLPPCTKQTDTFKIIFPCPLPELQTSHSCGEAANGKAWVTTATNNPALYNYIWKDQSGTIMSATDSLINAKAGKYTLQITTNTGCDTLILFDLIADDYQVSFDSDTFVCQDQNIQFNNTSDNYYTDFQWFFGDNNTSLSYNANHNYDQNGSYTVMLTGKGEYCSDTAYKNVFVDSIANDFSFEVTKKEICVGESILLKATIDSTIKNFSWDLGDDNLFRGSKGNIQHSYDQDGEKQIRLTAHFRVCPDLSDTTTIFVYPLPIVDLGNDTTICPNSGLLTLSNQKQTNNTDHYLWNTGDSTPYLSITQSGIYALTITSSNGCSGREQITILKDCYLDIPNVFSPNQDGSNDYFFPRQLLSKSISQFKMQVLNRWGQLVFESINIQGRGWDGKFNDKDQPQGVYIYRIEVEIDGKRNEKYDGNVTLLR